METPLSRLASRCKQCLAVGGGPAEIQTLVADAMCELASGERQEAIDDIAHRSDELLVVGLAQPAYGNTPIHSHGGIWCVIGVADGREENALYVRSPQGLREAGRFAIAAGEAAILGPDTIHKIRNPDGKRSISVHVYGGDLLSATRHMWSPQNQEMSLLEQSQFENWCAELTAEAEKSGEARACW